jgi:hypothetical protein
MLLFRNTEWGKSLSPEEMQQVAGKWMAWFKGLSEQGKVTAGSPLEPQGMVISKKNGRIVADGPFAESKEGIGGYFLLQVPTIEEAMAIAKECPGLPYGAEVEVRAVAAACPLSGEAVPDIELACATA